MNATTIAIGAVLAGAVGLAIWFAVAKWRAYRKGRTDVQTESLAAQAEALADEQKRQAERERLVLPREREIARGVSADRAVELLSTWPDRTPPRPAS